jgi:hypothetical protein
MKFELLIESLELLCEKKRRRTIPKSKVKGRSHENRKERAKNVKIRWLEEESIQSGEVSRHRFLASSAEQSESKEHEGFVDLFEKSGRIDNASCSCADFNSRFAFWREKEGVSDSKDRVEAKNDIFNPHTKDKPDIMNKTNKGYLCKHLVKATEELDKR